MNAFVVHKENSPGDFYVEEGCCLTCAVPHTVAPDLFGWTSEGNEQCIVCKQPSTAEELDRMFAAFQVADMNCIRYKGTARPIQVRLVAAREGAQCDFLPPDLLARAGPKAPVFGVSFSSDVRAVWSVAMKALWVIRKWVQGKA